MLEKYLKSLTGEEREENKVLIEDWNELNFEGKFQSLYLFFDSISFGMYSDCHALTYEFTQDFEGQDEVEGSSPEDCMDELYEKIMEAFYII